MFYCNFGLLSILCFEFAFEAHATFVCPNGVTIEEESVCDHLWDCDDGEDENNCRSLQVKERFNIFSPGYLENTPYSNNQKLIWTIRASFGLVLGLSFQANFGIEDIYDWLTIGEGTRPLRHTEIGIYSGHEVPKPFFTKSRGIWLSFQTDGDKSFQGFFLEVLALNLTDIFYCEKGDIVRPSQICNFMWDCPDGRDEENCEPVLDDEVLILTSPGFPDGYYKNMEILWTGTTSRGRRFLIEFVTFRTEKGFDLLQVGSGTDCRHSFDRSFSGVDVPGALTTQDNTLCIYFSSDYSITSTGFLLNISSVENVGMKCGERPAEGLSPRIIGGTDATLGNWPWIGSIKESSGDHLCAASLIHPEWAVTAGHCIGREGHEVVFGNLLLSASSHFQQRFTYTSFRHPQFSPQTLRHDVALLHLNQSIEVTNYVRPVCLAQFQNETTVYEECRIAGWGVRDQKIGMTSDSLQEAVVPILDSATCNTYLGRIIQLFPNAMICAGYHEGGIDSCDGDSGGPLMCRNGDGMWDLVGVTSFGVFCAFPERPGIYARISTHLDFISEHVAGLFT